MASPHKDPRDLVFYQVKLPRAHIAAYRERALRERRSTAELMRVAIAKGLPASLRAARTRAEAEAEKDAA